MQLSKEIIKTLQTLSLSLTSSLNSSTTSILDLQRTCTPFAGSRRGLALELIIIIIIKSSQVASRRMRSGRGTDCACAEELMRRDRSIEGRPATKKKRNAITSSGERRYRVNKKTCGGFRVQVKERETG